jgi:hypothetical protein
MDRPLRILGVGEGLSLNGFIMAIQGVPTIIPLIDVVVTPEAQFSSLYFFWKYSVLSIYIYVKPPD